MAVFETWLKSDLKKPLNVQKLSGNLFSSDNGGNLIGVEVLDNGSPATLTGGVTGYLIREDGATVTVTGTLSGNRASIVLPSSAYIVVGFLSIVIKVGSTTVGACTGYVYRTTTDSLVDPGHVIPSIEELLAQIENCRQATTSANTAASSANSAASNANTKASLADEKAGLANTAAGTANTAASAANAAATKIDGMTVAASGLSAGSSPTATVSEVSGHKHIAFGIPKGDPGKDFHISKTFASIAEMMAYTGTDIEPYDFAMIDTGSVQDPDTGKLYCYEPETQDRWRYIGDLSGAQGIKGETGTGIDHVALNQDYTLTIYLDDGTDYTTASIRGATGITPAISVGTVATLQPNQSAYVQLDQSSTAEAPVFNFGIPKGDTGTAENVYGSTIPMTPQDSTKISEAIGNKLDTNQGSANAGKVMLVGSDGALTPQKIEASGIYYGTCATGASTQQKVVTLVGEAPAELKEGMVFVIKFTAGTSYNGKPTLKIGDFSAVAVNNGYRYMWNTNSTIAFVYTNNLFEAQIMGLASTSYFGITKLSSATNSTSEGLAATAKAVKTAYDQAVKVMVGAGDAAGEAGRVPAPAIGDDAKFLKGDGTWDTPEGCRLWVFDLDSVTNTSGSYTHTTTVTGMNSDLKCVKLECSDPTIFKAPVSIVTGADSVTLTCSNVAGSSTVKASFLVVGNGNPLSSSEYAALDTRIGQLADLDTTDKSDIVSAINENVGNIPYCVDYTGTTSAIGPGGSFIKRFSELGLVLPTGYHVVSFSGWITGAASTLGTITGQGLDGTVNDADLGFNVHNGDSSSRTWTYRVRLLIGKIPS